MKYLRNEKNEKFVFSEDTLKRNPELKDVEGAMSDEEKFEVSAIDINLETIRKYLFEREKLGAKATPEQIKYHLDLVKEFLDKFQKRNDLGHLTDTRAPKEMIYERNLYLFGKLRRDFNEKKEGIFLEISQGRK